MASPIDRAELIRLVEDESAQVVDVLPVREFEQQHIPGAISIHLKQLNEETTRVLDRTKPVAVY